MKTCLSAVVVSASLAACGGGYSNGAIEHVKPMNLFPSGVDVSFAVKPGKDAKKGFVIVHRCTRCGELHRNRAAHEAAIQPDNKKLLIALTAKPITK